MPEKEAAFLTEYPDDNSIKIKENGVYLISYSLCGATNEDCSLTMSVRANDILQPTADENGVFEADLDTTIPDNTRIKIISSLNSYYTERKVTVPFSGELTLLRVTENIPFSMNSSSIKPLILPKKNQTVVTVVDSRINSSKWKLYLNYTNPIIEKEEKVLIDSLVFKKFDNEEIILKTNKKLIYESSDNGGNISVSNVTFSTDKGLLLKLSKDLLLFYINNLECRGVMLFPNIKLIHKILCNEVKYEK